MKHMFGQMSDGTGVVDQLDGVWLSRRTRERAQAHLRKADSIVNGVIRFVAQIRAVVIWIERVIAQSERRIKAALNDRSDSSHV